MEHSAGLLTKQSFAAQTCGTLKELFENFRILLVLPSGPLIQRHLPHKKTPQRNPLEAFPFEKRVHFRDRVEKYAERILSKTLKEVDDF